MHVVCQIIVTRRLNPDPKVEASTVGCYTSQWKFSYYFIWDSPRLFFCPHEFSLGQLYFVFFFQGSRMKVVLLKNINSLFFFHVDKNKQSRTGQVSFFYFPCISRSTLFPLPDWVQLIEILNCQVKIQSPKSNF